MSRLVVPLLCLAALAGCATDVVIDSPHDDSEQVARLEGAALTAELVMSPARAAAAPFVRIGLVWDADRPQALEVATSVDGRAWSPWRAPEVHHVEVEGTASFVGEVTVDGPPARFYRLRGGPGALTASFVRLERLTRSLSDSVEDREDLPTGRAATGPAQLTVGDVTVRPRADWGARATRCSAPLGDVYRMAVHHTESPTSDSMTPAARLRQTQTYHMDTKGWCDIAYHYLISRDGQIWEGRAERLLGTHTGSNNTGNVGVAMLGSYMTTPINAAQLDALAGLLRGLADKHDVAITRAVIKGHRQYTSTDCPGDALYGQLDAVVARAAAGGGGGGGGGGGTPVTVKGTLWRGADTTDRVAGATVTLGGRTTTSALDGTWSFAGVAPGAFTVGVSAAGLMSVSVTRQTEGEPTWVSLSLAPAGGTTGTAILQGVIYQGTTSSNRVAGATVALSTGQTITADGNGFYKVTGLPAGPITVTASKAGFTTASVARTLVDGQVEWGSVRIDPSGGGGGGGGGAVWRPAPGTTWQLQYAGALDTTVAAQVYDVDLENTSAAQLAALAAAGRKVVCYFSAGTYEPYRSDSAQFPAAVKGQVLPDWPDERWLDTRSAAVRQIMLARLDVARQKGCHAVDPDNVDAYANSSGFPLTAATQVDYLRFLSSAAHARGLAVGLKNATDLVPQVVGDFDFTVNEECYQFGECGTVQPFIAAGKAVFHVEYTDDTTAATFRGAICNQTRPMGLSSILKNRDLDAPRTTCP